MKIPIMFYVIFTTILLIAITIVVTMNVPLTWVFYLTCFGQAFVLLMVYKVLKDNYSTEKEFEDYYEDYPICRIESYR